MPDKRCACGLCDPQPGHRYHPKWGYDLDEAKKTACLDCGEPIGEEPYSEVTTLARFGSMMLVHNRCKKGK